MADDLGDADLEMLSSKYNERYFYDSELKKTLLVRCVMFDKRDDKEYYQVTVVEVMRDAGGEWAIPESSYVKVKGKKVVMDSKLSSYYVMDVTNPDKPVAFEDVDAMIQAHEEREATRETGNPDTGAVGAGSKRKFRRRK